MYKKLFPVLVILIAVTSVSIAGSVPDMEEGLWEITTKMSMPGMSMPPVTNTQCLTKKDFVPESSQPNQECSVTDIMATGNTVTWKMRCKSQDSEMKGTGTMTYSGNSFKGTFKMTVTGEENMDMISHMSGRRIGDCK